MPEIRGMEKAVSCHSCDVTLLDHRLATGLCTQVLPRGQIGQEPGRSREAGPGRDRRFERRQERAHREDHPGSAERAKRPERPDEEEAAAVLRDLIDARAAEV